MRRTDYYPAWLDRLADDVILEGSVMNGSVRGPEAVRTILGHARTLYEYQDFSFAGEFGAHGFLEDYTCRVQGEPIGSVVVITRNDAGQTERIVVSHRPRSSVLLFSRLMGEKLAGTPYREHFLTGLTGAGAVPAEAAAPAAVEG
jgi:hypothetical protein